MRYQFKFQKLLSLKENEKKQVLANYNDSVKEFEQVAEKLYTSLKQKEDLEALQREKLSSGLSIYEIRHQQRFIANLEKTITFYQKQVIQSRNRMHQHQAKLVEKNIEVKKYEIISEKDYQAFLHNESHEENKQMDDISIQQYMNRVN